MALKDWMQADAAEDRQWHVLKLMAVREKALEIDEDPEYLLGQLLHIFDEPLHTLFPIESPVANVQ